MKINGQVQKILANYESDNPGTKANLARILMHGKLGGTGKLLILPVDQGVEHGPARSFAPNPPAYDPHYHWQLAIEAGLSAFAAPLGFIEGGASTYAGQVPTILKVNGANSLARAKEAADNAVTPASRTRCASGARRSASRSIPPRTSPIRRCATLPRWRARPKPMAWRW